MTDYNKIEEIIISYTPDLYFKGTLKKDAPKDLKELILWIRAKCQTEPTYDFKTKYEQCSAGRARSTQDLYMLARHYQPKTTFKMFAKAIGELAAEFKIGSNGFCSTIKRRIWYQAKDFGTNPAYTLTSFGYDKGIFIGTDSQRSEWDFGMTTKAYHFEEE